MNIIGERNIQSYIESPKNVPETHVFVVYDDNTWSFKEVLYSEMTSHIAKVCNALLQLGINKGDKVNIHCSNCLEYIYSLFALGCIGAIMVPTDINLAEKEWEYILNDTGAKTVITEPAFISSFKKIRSKCPSVKKVILFKSKKEESDFTLFSDIFSKATPKFPVMDISSLDDFAIYYSRGEEGNLEGVVLSQAFYLYWGEIFSRALKYQQTEVIMESNQISDPVNQIKSIMAGFIAGSKIILSEKFFESEWIHQVGRFAPYWQKNMARGIFGFLTADQAIKLLTQPPSLRDSKTALKLTMYTGELSQDDVDMFSNRFQTHMARFFGMAEFGIPFMNPVWENKIKSFGKLTLGVKAKVVDDLGKEVSIGKTGNLVINGGPGVSFCKGYYKNEDKNNRVIKEEWLYTDIKVKCDKEGYFYPVD